MAGKVVALKGINQGSEKVHQAFFVIIRGPLGAGKTTISKELARDYNAHHISIDEILEKFNLEEWEDGYISEMSFLRVNEIAAKESMMQLENGLPVIFDGNFYYKSVILDLIGRLKEFEGIVITLAVPLEVCMRRDASRRSSLGENETRMVHKKSTEFNFGIEVNADRGRKEVLDNISRIIKTKMKN